MQTVWQIAELRFSPVPDKLRERIAAAPAAMLLAWLGQLPNASSLAQVFGNGEGGSGSPQVS